MIAWQVKERHLEVFDEAVELFPLPPDFLLVFLPASPGNQIAHRDDKLWLQLVYLFDGAGKNTRSHAAGSVRYDGELEIIGIVAERFLRPGLLKSRYAVREICIILRARLAGKGEGKGDKGEDFMNWFKDTAGIAIKAIYE